MIDMRLFGIQHTAAPPTRVNQQGSNRRGMADGRRGEVQAYINEKGSASIRELMDLFPDVAMSTIYGDLEFLVDTGRIYKAANCKPLRWYDKSIDPKTTEPAVTSPHLLREELILKLPRGEWFPTAYIHKNIETKVCRANVIRTLLRMMHKGLVLWKANGKHSEWLILPRK